MSKPSARLCPCPEAFSRPRRAGVEPDQAAEHRGPADLPEGACGCPLGIALPAHTSEGMLPTRSKSTVQGRL